MKKNIRKALWLLLKCAVAAALLVWLLRKVHWHAYTPSGAAGPMPGLLDILRDVNVWLLAAGAAGSVLSLLVTAVRMWMLLRIQDVHVTRWECVRLTFLGQFFNVVVPGQFGGDLVKAYYISKHTPKKAAVLLTVFVDRVLGLTELTVLAATMIVIVLLGHIEPFAKIRMAALAMAGISAGVVITLGLLLSPRWRSALRLKKIYERLPMAHHFAAAGDAALLYRRRLGVFLRSIAVTFGAHILWIGGIAVVGMSLSLPVPWYNYFIYVPLIYTVGALPLTPGGVGIVENCYVLFLGVAGAGNEKVFALAILARLIPMLWALPGAVVAVTGPKLPKAAAMEAELGLEEPAAKSRG